MVMENVRGVNQYPIIIPISGDSAWRSYGGIFTIAESLYSPGVYVGVEGDLAAIAEYDNLGVFEVSLPPIPK